MLGLQSNKNLFFPPQNFGIIEREITDIKFNAASNSFTIEIVDRCFEDKIKEEKKLRSDFEPKILEDGSHSQPTEEDYIIEKVPFKDVYGFNNWNKTYTNDEIIAFSKSIELKQKDFENDILFLKEIFVKIIWNITENEKISDKLAYLSEPSDWEIINN